MVVMKFLTTAAMGLAVSLPVILYSQIGYVEGDLFPVSTELEIMAMTPAQGGVDIDVLFTKSRRCTYRDMQWYVETYPDVWREVIVIFPKDKPRTRPLGRFEATWTLLMPAKYIGRRLQQELFHSCWAWPFTWETITTQTAKLPKGNDR
jgi:hypothetical protein